MSDSPLSSVRQVRERIEARFGERFDLVVDWLGDYGWLSLGGIIVVVAFLQLYGPLPAARSTVLLLVIGLALVVWGLALRRARWVLETASQWAWPLIGAFAVLMVALQASGVLTDYWTTILLELSIFAVLALSWDLVGGQTGYPSFGNMAFFGVGAYTSAILVKKFGVDVFPAFAAAGLAAIVFAAFIGLIVLRLRGHYFAIATLGVLLASTQIATNLEITNGSSGIILLEAGGPINDVLLETFALSQQGLTYYLIVGVLVAEIAVVYFLTGTRFGYILNTIRDDEQKATSMGINTTYYKTGAWMLAALFTGLVGAVWAPYSTFVNPAQAFNPAWNVELIVMAFLGGPGTVAGPVLGAFGLGGFIFQIETFFSGWQLAVLGIAVILTVIAFPQGLVGQLQERASAMEYFRHGGGAAGEDGTEPDTEATDGGNQP
jgi:branched-chain amino acid transport system permease protein